jgi:hypothetical protein
MSTKGKSKQTTPGAAINTAPINAVVAATKNLAVAHSSGNSQRIGRRRDSTEPSHRPRRWQGVIENEYGQF